MRTQRAINRARTLVATVAAILVMLALGIGIVMAHPMAGSGSPRSPVATPTVASVPAAQAGDQSSTTSRLDLEIHEQDYCQCHQ
jgi:hypothetical protein